MKKIATPEEVATQIVLLSSEKVSSHTTGEVTLLAGGMEGERYDCQVDVVVLLRKDRLTRYTTLLVGRLLNPK